MAFKSRPGHTADTGTGGDQRPVILLTYRYFSTQHEAQGPTQSLRAMIRMLGHRYRFKLISIAMPGERECEWEKVFGVERIAVAAGPRGLRQFRHILTAEAPELLVLNSFFDPLLTIAILAMRKLRLIPPVPVIVAPRGEFSPGALALKPRRKTSYLRFARFTGLTRGVTFQATDPSEVEAIRDALPSADQIVLAPNIRALEPLPEHESRAPGQPVRFVFLSRIDRKKNLDLALRLLAESGVSARFDIVGPVHDPAYWVECQALAAAMPANVQVRHIGAVPAAEVLSTLAGRDVMLLPTAGENYGHALVEAFLAATPVLVSDQTPWRGLEPARAGADIALDDHSAWIDWIRRFAAMSEEELASWRAGAREFAERRLDPERHAQLLADCFDALLEEGQTGRSGSQNRPSDGP